MNSGSTQIYAVSLKKDFHRPISNSSIIVVIDVLYPFVDDGSLFVIISFIIFEIIVVAIKANF